jgi:hypothetical protein
VIGALGRTRDAVAHYDDARRLVAAELGLSQRSRAPARRCERQATWVTSYRATDRRRRVCVFAARDAESVGQAYRLSGVKFDRVWAADQIEDDDDDD